MNQVELDILILGQETRVKKVFASAVRDFYDRGLPAQPVQPQQPQPQQPEQPMIEPPPGRG